MWTREAKRAFEWFLGRNDLGLPLYDFTTGGCGDGLHHDRVNENQGAESTLAFHLALAVNGAELGQRLLERLAPDVHLIERLHRGQPGSAALIGRAADAVGRRGCYRHCTGLQPSLLCIICFLPVEERGCQRFQ